MNTIVPRGRAIDALESATIRRITWRLMPVLMVGYFAAFLDRTNVAMAAPTMNPQLGFSAAVYGFGAGLFFLGYFLAEIPSNLVLDKVGARRWLARILITWGVLSGLTAFVWNDWSFYTVRLLLGVAEAGFFPGVVLYLTWWYPSFYASRMIAVFYSAAVAAMIIWPPISGLLLRMEMIAGLHGWQWLFLMEAVPAVVMCFVNWFLLTDRPSEAEWLAPEQRNWLIGRLVSERTQLEAAHKYSLVEALTDRKVVLLSLAYLTHSMAGYSVMFFLPLILTGLGVASLWLGLVTAIPSLVALAAMNYWGSHSDRSGDRYWHVVGGWILETAAMAGSIFIGAGHPLLLYLALIVASCCNWAVATVFWSIPSAILTGTAAAGGIAMINSIGQLGGWFGPWVFGLVKDWSGGSDKAALFVLALGPLIAAAFVTLAGIRRQLEHAANIGRAADFHP